MRAPHVAGPAAAIVIVIAIGIYSYMDGQAYREAADWAERSRTLVERLHSLMSQLKDAETGQRGYLLTGDLRYLEPYTAALPKIEALRGELATAAAARPDEVRRLSALVGMRLAELAQTIQVRQSGRAAEAVALVQTDRGKEAMDTIRALVADLVAMENAELKKREDDVARHGYRTRIVVLAGAVLLALLLWLTSSRVSHLVRAQEGLIADLAHLKEEEARGHAALATTLRSIGDAVITTDVMGRVKFMNPVAEALTGWSEAAAQQRPLPEVFRIVNETTRQEVENPASKVLRDGIVVGLANHTILLSRDGRQIPIDDSGAPIPGESGAVSGVVLVFRDVTQRRQTQRDLEERERRYRLLFEANPWPMWVYDTDGLAFLAVNEAATRRYGYSREEFLQMTLRDIRPPEDVPALLANVAQPDRELHTDGPWRHRRKDGSLLHVEITSHPIQFGKAKACLVLVNDITARMKLEDQLRQAQKLEAVGQLAGGIAHDFNNLLTVVEGYAELVYGDLPATDPSRESVQEILVAAQRAASLTRQLLAFSRRQLLQPIRLNLNANVASTHGMLNRLLGENIEVTAELAEGLWDVHADPGQIDQILLNLAVNARDAMESGGRLTIRTANVELGGSDSEVLDAAVGRYVRLSLTDTGHGMDPETQSHIFEPFFTTKEIGRGTGLGLSTVYGIVKQSGGYIRVESEPGKGSTFSIFLPAVPERGAAPASGSAAQAAPQHAGATILVVEDDEVVRRLVVSMLHSSGYRVISPATPRDALAVCADTGTQIDLLITDMVLPETDGGAIAETAQRLRPGLKVLFMSGYTEHPVLRRKTMDSNMPFLQKPFSKAVLLAKVREVLG
jgi:PAS domain S-box-containing protein